MDAPYTDSLLKMIYQRIEVTRGEMPEMTFHYQLMALVMALAHTFGDKEVEAALMGVCNLNLTIDEVSRIHKRIGVV